jgi:transposase-like protein
VTSVLSAIHFHDEAAAYSFVEARLWANGRVCPHCGVVDRSGALKGKTTRIGLYKCYACRKPFTVKIGTIFEGCHVKMHVWLQAIHLMVSSKKGVSANQLHRTLGVTLKTAWFLAHRLRESMREGALAIPFGTGGGIVESDEAFLTRKRRRLSDGNIDRRDLHKTKILTLVDRTTKRARSTVIPNLRKDTIMAVVNANVSREARMMTDQAGHYKKAFVNFAGHETVDHSKEEYVRGEAHTNTAEGFFSVFKKGMHGIYQHCAEKHLHRYLAEFDFRYNNRQSVGVGDAARADRAIAGARGKRLMYRDSLRWASQ